MVLNYREYTALFYLSKGNIIAFKQLLLEDILKDVYDTSIKRLIELDYIGKKGNIIFITSKGIDLVKKKNKKDDEIPTCRDWVDEFRKQFQSNRMEDKDDVIKALDEFIEKYKYTKEQILKGTEEYIKKDAETNHLYQKKSTNFIKKELKTNCEYIKLNENSKQNSVFNNKFLI